MALPPQKLLNEKIYYVDYKGNISYGYIIKTGPYITSTEGLTCCMYETNNDDVVRSCDILHPEEAKLLAFTKGVTLDFFD